MNYQRGTEAVRVESPQVFKAKFIGFGFLYPPHHCGGNYFCFGSRFSDAELMQ